MLNCSTVHTQLIMRKRFSMFFKAVKLKLWQYILGCILTTVSFAVPTFCSYATPSSETTFCDSFKLAAECRCVASGLPKGMCSNMELLYSRMVSMFGSLERACQFQHDTSLEECMEDWQCYRYGGTNGHNEPCSGTGRAC